MAKTRNGPVYRRVQVSIWNERWFMGLSDSAKLAYWFIRTNPAGNLLGVFHFGPGALMDRFGWDGATVAQVLAELLAQQLDKGRGNVLHYDEPARLVMVCNFLQEEGLANHNAITSALAALENLTDSAFIFEELLNRVQALGKAYARPLEQELMRRLENCRAEGSGNGRGNGCANQDTGCRNNPQSPPLAGSGEKAGKGKRDETRRRGGKEGPSQFAGIKL